MSDFNSDDLDRLSASIIAMNRTMVGLTRTIQDQQRDMRRSSPRQPASRVTPPQTTPRQNQQPVATGRTTPTSDGVNVSKPKSNNQQSADAGTGAALWGASKKATGAMTDSTVNASNSLRKLDSEFGLVSDTLSNFKGAVGVFGVLAYLGNAIGETLDTYKSLADVGQSFGGSMGQMQLAAAEARMPLEQFAANIRNYSKVMAVTGVHSFSAMNKGLRDSLSSFGLLGMSTEELSDFMGGYLEMQRKSGTLGRQSDISTMDNMRTMAIEASKVSALTGESRKKILENTMAAMTENSYMTKKFLMTGDAAGRLEKGMTTASTYLAGMPGEAGTRLSNMLAETVGKGTAVLSEDVQTFARLGMGGVVSMFDNLAEKTKNGTATIEDMEAFRADFVAQGKANMASLQYQANHANNPEAKRALEMIMEMSNISAEELKKLAEQKKVTNFFMNLQNTLQTVTAFVKEKFVKAIMNVTGNIEDFAETPAFKDLQERFGKMAEKFGSWIGTLLADEKRMKEVVDTIMNVATGVGKLFLFIADTASKLAPVFETLTAIMGTVVGTVASVIDKFGLFGVLLIAGVAKTVIMMKNLVGSYIKDVVGKFTGLDSGGLMKNGKFGRNGALLVFMENMPVNNNKPGRDGGNGRDGKNGTPGNDGAPGEVDKTNGKDGKKGGGKNGKKGGSRAQRRAARRAGKGGGVASTSMIGSNLATPMEFDDQDVDNLPDDKKKPEAKGKKVEPTKGKTSLLDKMKGIKAPSIARVATSGVAGMAAQYAADTYAESGGPGASSVGVLADTASWAATGAMLGPMGALAGGVLGGGYSLYKNWDAVSGEVGSLFGVGDKAGKSEPGIFSGVSDWFGFGSDKKASAFDGEKTAAVSDSGSTQIKDNQKISSKESRVEKVDTITTNDMGSLGFKGTDMATDMLNVNRQMLLTLERMNGNVETGTAVQRAGLGEVVNNTTNKGYQTGTEFS